MILPLETTTAVVLVPEQVLPTATTTHAPSKLLLPPPRDAERRGSSASGLLRRAGRSGSADRGVWREPDSDFSSLPILPPALPDCATATLGLIATASEAQSRAILVRRRMASCMSICFPIRCAVLAAGPVGTDRADDAARFASPAALVKRGVLGPLDGVTLDQRP